MLKNLIIGAGLVGLAGLAGLAVVGQMRQAGSDFEIFEKEDKVGSVYFGKMN